MPMSISEMAKMRVAEVLADAAVKIVKSHYDYRKAVLKALGPDRFLEWEKGNAKTLSGAKDIFSFLAEHASEMGVDFEGLDVDAPPPIPDPSPAQDKENDGDDGDDEDKDR